MIEENASNSTVFHALLIPYHEGNHKINITGGRIKIETELLHDYLKKSVGPPVKSSGYYARYLTVQKLLEESNLSLRKLWKNVAAERFRLYLLECLDFMRNARIIEILPVIAFRDGKLTCEDHVILQDHDSETLSTAPFKQKAIIDSVEIVGQWLFQYPGADEASINEKLDKLNPAFIEHLPYYQLARSLESDWHSPHDAAHAFFRDVMRFKKSDFLSEIYASLESRKKLHFETRVDGIRKLGGRFPFAWPVAPRALDRLDAIHRKLREIFARNILMSEQAGAAATKSGFPLYHKNIPSDKFQAAYATFVKDGSPLPSVVAAHNMAVHAFKSQQSQFLQSEETLKASTLLHFARNLLVMMIMHSDTVLERQKEREKERIEETIEAHVRRIAGEPMPFVDLNGFVMQDADVITSDQIKKMVIERIKKHEKIKSIEIVEKPTFGAAGKIVLAFHVSRLNDVFAEANRRAREEKNFTLHINLERMFESMTSPDRLRKQLRPEIFDNFYNNHTDFYVNNQPLLKKWFFKVFHFIRKPKSDKVKKMVQDMAESERIKVKNFYDKEQQLEIEKRRKEIVSAALKKSERREDPAADEHQPPESPGSTAYASVGASPAPDLASPGSPDARPAYAKGSPGTSPAFGKDSSGASPAYAKDSSDARSAFGQGSSDASPAHAKDSSGAISAFEEGSAGASPAYAKDSSGANPESYVDTTFDEHRKTKKMRDVDLSRLLGMATDESDESDESDASDDPDEPHASDLPEETEEAPAPHDKKNAITSERLQELLEEASREKKVNIISELPPEVRAETSERPSSSSAPGAARAVRSRSPDTPQIKEWETEVIKAGFKVGVDLTEDARLERLRIKEEKRKEKETQTKLAERQKMRAKAQSPTRRTYGTPDERSRTVGPVGSKHLVIISVPLELSVSGKPGRIQFKRQFFKDEKFRQGMADFYRAEAAKAAAPEEKKYFNFLINAIENNHAAYLKSS